VIPCERITSDPNYFLWIFRLLTQNLVKPTAEYLDAVFAMGRLNSSGYDRPGCALESYAGWLPWQKDMFRQIAQWTNLFDAYLPHGYDLAPFLDGRGDEIGFVPYSDVKAIEELGRDRMFAADDIARHPGYVPGCRIEGDGRARILDYLLVAGAGRYRTDIRRFSRIDLFMKISFEEEMDDYFVGIEIKDANGNLIGENNSSHLNVEQPRAERGGGAIFRSTFRAVFPAGRYFISMLVGRLCGTPCDFRHCCIQISVAQDPIRLAAEVGIIPMEMRVLT
jgi:hypothetical protein